VFPRALYRPTFALGVTVFVTAFVLGIMQAWRSNGWIPELPFDELGQAREATSVGDLAAAEHQLRTYAALQPEKVDVWLRLGQFLQGTGNRRGAIDAYERALTILPTPLAAHQQLAILYVQEGDVPRAREHAEIVLKNGGGFAPDVRQALGL
jgi:cytochrome c-type biogenesis protein CcmH/NrfG